MKKLFLFVLIAVSLCAQTNNFQNYPLPGQGTFTGGVGLNWIDGKLFYALHFISEASFGNWGAGLDLQFDINQQGKFRKENYNEFSDYLSIIRYVRYGMKNDPLYVKVGSLDYYTLGHGSIINYYNNSPGFDSRKIGMVAHIDYGKFGVESIYGNFLQAGVIGIRGYYRPFQFTSQADIPLLGKLELGATFASDFNDKAGIISGSYDKAGGKIVPTADRGSVNIIGLDFGFPIFNVGLLDVSFYTDYSSIINFGSGIATGFKFDINALGDVRGFAKFERRFTFGQYLPSYFNSFYEIQRFQTDTANGTFTSKASILASMNDSGNGYAMELGINIAGLFNISGYYDRSDMDPNSGVLHISAEINPTDGFFIARAGYDKINFQGKGDLFKLDDRSYLYVEIGYKPLPNVILSFVYNWMFTPVRDSDENIIGYKPQERVEPRLSLLIPIQF